MKIIISPAKQMKTDQDWMKPEQLPALLEDTRILYRILRSMNRTELKKLFGASDKITEENYVRYQAMNLEQGLTTALLAYQGLAFSSMAPQVFTDRQWAYARKHLKILSGFYGILNTGDGVAPYRLEMQARLHTERGSNLYEFWGDRIYRTLAEELKQEAGEGEEKIILNLASKEYSRVIEPWARTEPGIQFVTCVFGEWTGEKVKVKGTLAKMARGRMCAWLAAEEIQDTGRIREFRELGFSFEEALSTPEELVFLRRAENH